MGWVGLITLSFSIRATLPIYYMDNFMDYVIFYKGGLAPKFYDWFYDG